MNNFKRTLFVNILNKALDTALIDKVILNNIFKVTLVTKLNVNTCIEKCLFTKSSFQNAVIVNRSFFKNFRVGFKAYFRTLNIRLADFLKVGYNFSSFITLEVNILNFSGDIYNNEITVTFIQHVRGDIKFDTLDQLIDQLKKDRETVDRILTE